MPNRTSKTGSELFIVDNSDEDWKVLRYLHDWCQISKRIDIATGYFEIGSLLGLKDEWQKVDQIRILMGDEVSRRTKTAFAKGLAAVRDRLDASLEDGEAQERLPRRRPGHRRRPSGPAKLSAASTARPNSMPRRTSPTPAWKSSAPSAWWAPPTSPFPA